MEKNSLSKFGWLVIVVIIICILLGASYGLVHLISANFKTNVNGMQGIQSDVLNNIGKADGFDDLNAKPDPDVELKFYYNTPYYAEIERAYYVFTEAGKCELYADIYDNGVQFYMVELPYVYDKETQTVVVNDSATLLVSTDGKTLYHDSSEFAVLTDEVYAGLRFETMYKGTMQAMDLVFYESGACDIYNGGSKVTSMPDQYFTYNESNHLLSVTENMSTTVPVSMDGTKIVMGDEMLAIEEPVAYALVLDLGSTDAGGISLFFAAGGETERYALVFTRGIGIQAGDIYSGFNVIAAYTGIESDVYASENDVPWSSYKDNIKTVVTDDEISPKSTAYWFHGFYGCDIDLSLIDTSKTKDMSYMFYGSSPESLTLPDAFGEAAENMSYMFARSSADITGLPTNFGKEAKDMSYMFNRNYVETIFLPAGCGENVENMSYMFEECNAASIRLQKGFGAKATDARCMFYYALSLKYLTLPSGFAENIGDLTQMFASCSALETLTIPFGQNATDMSSMFRDCVSLTSLAVPENFGGNAKEMWSMFYNCSMLSLDCTDWNVEKVTSYADFNKNAPGVIAPTWKN